MSDWLQKYTLGVAVPLTVALVLWLFKCFRSHYARRPRPYWTAAVIALSIVGDAISICGIMIPGYLVGHSRSQHPAPHSPVVWWFSIALFAWQRLWFAFEARKDELKHRLDKVVFSGDVLAYLEATHNLQSAGFWKMSRTRSYYLLLSTLIFFWLSLYLALLWQA